MENTTPQEVLDRLEIISEIIESEIRIEIGNKVDNLRLNFALRKKLDDSTKYTCERFQEVRIQLGKYEGTIAGFLREAIINEETFCDDSDFLKTLSYNYVSGLYWLEELEELDFEFLVNEDYTWESRIGNSESKKEEIKKFIQAMALVDLYHNLNLFQKTGVIEERSIDIKPIPSTKSLLFNGKKLNLSERMKIANEVLDFDNKISKLNISDPEKYQLMAYILGNDKDNIRNRITGTRSDKVREKELIKYIENLKR